MGRKNRSLGKKLASLLAILWSQQIASAYGEMPKVYPDEYVVELKPSVQALATTEGDIEIPRLPYPIQMIGSSTAFVATHSAQGALGISSNQERDAVPYDVSRDQCSELPASGVVEKCSPNFQVSVSTTKTANDPDYHSLWGLNAISGIDVAGAWNQTTGSADIVVAIVDTGLDYNHPDLRDNIWVNNREISGNGIDDDNNGYIDDIHGINAITRSGDPFDDNGHGTHCAGTIGAVGNNKIGVTGINWNVKMMGLKFLSASGKGGIAPAIESINYMTEMKKRGVNIRVSNNSWGGSGYSEVLASAIKRASDAGILFVAAAGNDNLDTDIFPSYPANYDSVISVAALDSERNLASFSNYGATSVDIAAPGVNILSTFPNGGYETMSGTSMAAPHVSGMMALLFAAYPKLTVAEGTTRLYDTGLALESIISIVRTGKMLHARRLMTNTMTPPPPPPAVPELCGYNFKILPYSEDQALESATMVLKGDEYNFKKISLPFYFPFGGALHKSIVLSPNGIVYLGSAPLVMDYINGPRAPIFSIAAFHADLVMDGDLGARVLIDEDRVSIYWLAENYGLRAIGISGRIAVRLVLDASGAIESYVSFSNKETERYMQNRATMGVTGPSDEYSKTFAFNDTMIRDRLGVGYTPGCGRLASDDQLLTKIAVRGKGE